MSKRKLKIFHIASEVEPFSKSGGLANVAASLPKAHSELGHEVSVITPFYQGIIDKKKYDLEEMGEEEIEVGNSKYKVSYLRGYLNGNKKVSVYFIENKKFFGKRNVIYGAKNENTRFFFFNVVALNLIKKLGEKPDIVQCHDWHTGLIPYFLKGRFKNDEFWSKTATLFTIHNLAYQLGHDWWSIPQDKKDDGRSGLPGFQETKKIENINFAKRAILSADAINTVSETYREEILTKSFGEDLHRILKNREKRVYGIVNGINYEEYNPSTDPGLFRNYNETSPEKKALNKKWLQKHFKLKIDPDTPIICSTSRITEQKGFEIFLQIISTLLKQDLQIIIMGDGDKKVISSLKTLKRKFPKKFVITPFSSKYETSLYAGSDIFILPSRFEPCGINQMIALRYGCIPIVHHIGGLADTISNFNPKTKKGNGFTFKGYNALSLSMAVARALETYKRDNEWKNLVVSGLREANSWKIPAQKYIELYKAALRFKKENGNGNH